MEDIIIKNANIATMDAKRRQFRDGSVVITGEDIVDVGKTSEILSNYRADKMIDGSGHFVTPGLINCHLHNPYFITKGLFDDGGFISQGNPNWWVGFSYPFEGNLTKPEIKAGAMGNYVEMIQNGGTCFSEIGAYHDHSDIAAECMQQIGIRGIITRAARDMRSEKHPIPDNMFETTDQTLRKTEDIVKKWNGAANGLIRVWFSLRFSYNASDELMVRSKELADRYGVGLQGHAAGFEVDNEDSVAITGLREVERYNKLGILDRNVMLIHMGHVTDQEIGYLKKHDVKVCHCPSASMKALLGAIRTGKILEMIKAGVTVALGVDSTAESNFVDMVREAYLAAAGHMEVFPGQTVLGAHKAMEMLTIDGAKALGWDKEIGSIEKGKKADIAIFNMKGMEWHPQTDPVASLIYSATGASAETVIINGKTVMENRKILTVNEDKIVSEVDEAGRVLWNRLGVKTRPAWQVD